MIDKIQLKETIEELKSIYQATLQETPNNEFIFEQSCMFLRGELANRNKWNYNSKVNGSSNTPTGAITPPALTPENNGAKEKKIVMTAPIKIIPPSDKQLAFLKNNNWTGELPKTRKEATIIIKNYINNLKKENL